MSTLSQLGISQRGHVRQKMQGHSWTREARKDTQAGLRGVEVRQTKEISLIDEKRVGWVSGDPFSGVPV